MNQERKQFIYSFLPGYFHGLSKVFTTYPFDVIKIKMQTNTYKTTYSCVKNLIKYEPKIFFRGISLPLITFPIDRAISYKIYDDINKNYNPYFSAFVAGIASSFINVPMQYVTTNAINTNKDNYHGIVKFIKTLKIHNIYKGYSLDTSRLILGSTIFLGTYGNIKNYLPDNDKNTILASIISISSTWIITFPMDSVRVDYQITKNDSIKNLIKYRFNKYGIKNFYKGLTPILLRSIPSTIIGMLVYENVKKKINSF